MQVRDEGLWHDLVKDLKSTDIGQSFYEFIAAWCDNAEQVIAQGGSEADPADALRLALPATEETLERKNVWVIGQCLVVICMHWIHGEKAAQGFSELELRLVQDLTAAKIAQMQLEAEESEAAHV